MIFFFLFKKVNEFEQITLLYKLAIETEKKEIITGQELM